MANTITAANSVLTLSVANLYPIPQTIQGYAADDAFSTDSVVRAETQRGVDGRQSSGYVFNSSTFTINIMPDSPSLVIFETLDNAQKAAREVFICSGQVQLPSIGRKYTLVNGVLSTSTPITNVRRVLQSVQYVFTFEDIIGEPI